MRKRLITYYKHLVEDKVAIYPLATFRILFGIMMLISTIRFWVNGWIESLYLSPDFHFKFYGFYWVQAPSEFIIYSIFIALISSSLAIALGLFYRFFSILFFILFTYVELIDASNYLNHYYFVSIVAFLMIFLNANRFFSVDNLIFGKKQTQVQAWQINSIKILLGIVYFYAGLAKLNYDWIVLAEPLATWLPSKTHLPLIGSILSYKVVAYLFSWAGAIFDLSIFFILINKKLRIFGYAALVSFHLITSYLFPIGMFPYIMIASTLIFFSSEFHKKLYPKFTLSSSSEHDIKLLSSLGKIALFSFVFFHLVFPFRHLLYSGNLFWTEQGYRFSWRVMLMEKAGYAEFTVKDKTGKKEVVDNAVFLTPYQEKMMSTQADFILQYAHFLQQEFVKKGFEQPEVYADVYVTLNGRGSQQFIDPTVNLAQLSDSFKPKTFILPFHE